MFDELVILFLFLLGGFLISYFTIPKIINLVVYKRLMDDPNNRSSHSEATPSIGGVSFFLILILGFYFTQSYDQHNIALTLLPGLTILLGLGITDDLIVLSAKKKLIGQIAAATFVAVHPKFKIQSFHGFFSIEEIPEYVSIVIGMFIILAIINAFNLIDGIDGLASITAIVVFLAFITLFFYLGERFFTLMLISFCGSLAAFLRYNLSANKKIFMGDTGSMIIGFIIAITALYILSLAPQELRKLPFQRENLPLVLLAILIIPIFDTIRVFTIRLLNKKGPFSPDRNHIHHVLIDNSHFSHKKASLVLGVTNILIIGVFILIAINTSQILLVILLAILIMIATFFFFSINTNFRSRSVKAKFRSRLRKIKSSIKGN